MSPGLDLVDRVLWRGPVRCSLRGLEASRECAHQTVNASSSRLQGSVRGGLSGPSAERWLEHTDPSARPSLCCSSEQTRQSGSPSTLLDGPAVFRAALARAVSVALRSYE